MVKWEKCERMQEIVTKHRINHNEIPNFNEFRFARIRQFYTK